jgi:hypothetical protein
MHFGFGFVFRTKNAAVFEMPFIYRNDHFAKTGSGQT